MGYVNVDKIKDKITSEDVKKIMATFDCYPKSETNEYVLYPSICHHEDFMAHKAKLYWYKDAKYFLCYSCNSAFDIFGLIQQIKKCTFPQSIRYVCDALGIDSSDLNISVDKVTTYDWKLSLNKYITNTENKENKIYDKDILNQLDNIYYQGWIDEGISINTMQKFGIKFYKYKQQIVIPIFDDNNNFVGTHCRNLCPELIKQGLKYYHLVTLNGMEYKFNMSLVLFGLNFNRYNIEKTKTCIIFESPKSVMIYDGYDCLNNSVAIFGMNLQKAKRALLLKYKCENFIIALDRQYEQMYNEDNQKTEEFKVYGKTIMKMVDTLSPFAKKIWVMYDNDKDRLLDYKDAPIDKGKDVWDKLYRQKYLIYDAEEGK